MALAGRVADILVLDGVAQTSPVRAALALLAVDAREPWGRGGAVAPRGDLRAPKPILLRACDGVVSIADGSDTEVDMAENSEGTFGAWRGRAASRGVWVGGNLRTWELGPDYFRKLCPPVLCSYNHRGFSNISRGLDK